MAVSGLLGSALGDSMELPHKFSKWSVASERHFKSVCEMEGSARCGRAAAVRAQLPVVRVRPIPLKRVDEIASEGQGHLFWACVRGRLLEVKRGLERGHRNTGQFRKFVDFLRKCAGELPTIPASDQDPSRHLHHACTTISGLADSTSLNRSA